MESDIENHLMLEAESKRMATPATRVNENKISDEQRVKKNYSFLRAANLVANNKNLDGLELEMHQEAEREFRQAGISASGNLYIPKMIVKSEKRDMTAGTASQGGNTVPTILGDLIPFLDPRLAVINAGAAYWVKDIYQTFISPEASSKKLIWHSRAATVGIVVLGLAFSLDSVNINDIWGWITMAFGTGLFVPLLLRWYWWRYNGYGFATAVLREIS